MADLRLPSPGRLLLFIFLVAFLLTFVQIGIKMGAPVAAIGGAGSFDSIFLTGLVAVLLA